ncbi:Alpha/Beta hydrolase protein [Abortiporus biennis]|nr:Alpha/Beta hydrolase protein [Abortiporus biennis]
MMLRDSLLRSMLSIITLSITIADVSAFNPYKYPKKTAACQAINRATNETKTIQISYVDINPTAEKAIIFAHGWPGLWANWKYQIEAFEKDYHLILPDHRGFGDSTHPGDVETSGTWGDIVGDIVCVLQHEHVTEATCIGHDWGTEICFTAGRLRPDIFKAIVGTGVPYVPHAGHFVSTEALVPLAPKLAYQLYFQNELETATAELNRDIRRTLRSVLRSVESPTVHDFLTYNDSFLGAWKDVETIPSVPFLSELEEQYWVEQFSKQGFGNTFYFYTKGCNKLTWQQEQDSGNHTILQPALSILPTQDPVGNWSLISKMMENHKFIPKLREVTVDNHHWPQLEDPERTNKYIKEFLSEHWPVLQQHKEL